MSLWQIGKIVSEETRRKIGIASKRNRAKEKERKMNLILETNFNNIV